jgi:hypothetical protein
LYQLTFEEKIDGQYTTTYDSTPPDIGATNVHGYFDYIKPIMIQFENGTQANIFEDSKVETTNTFTSGNTIKEVKYTINTSEQEYFEKTEFYENGSLTELWEYWYDVKTGLLNQKHQKSKLLGEIDIVRKGYDRNVSNSQDSEFPSKWVFLTFSLIIIIRVRKKPYPRLSTIWI